MGQQQLLLIVLGVIIVGIAVVVGINVFTASSMDANRNAVISDLTNLASMAQQYYRKPTALAGGNQSFVGWSIPSSLTSTANGTYSIVGSGTSTSIKLKGLGTDKGNNGTGVVEVTMDVGPNAIDTTKVVN